MMGRRYSRTRVGLGDTSPGLQQVYNQLATLDYAYATLFPHVDIAQYDPILGHAAASLGDLLRAGVISQGEYEAAFGAVPSMNDPNIKSQYDAMVADTKRGMASGQYSADSLDSLTPDFYLNHYTPLAAQIATRAGGYTSSPTGGTQFVDSHNNVVEDAYIPPPAPSQAYTGPSKYLVGGQYFTDFNQAQAAQKALAAQMDAGGSAIFEDLQPGGVWAEGVQPGGHAAPSVPTVSSQSGGGGGGPASAPPPGAGAGYVPTNYPAAPSSPNGQFHESNGGGMVNPSPPNMFPGDNTYGPSGQVGGSGGAVATEGMMSNLTSSPWLLLAAVGAAVLLAGKRKRHG